LYSAKLDRNSGFVDVMVLFKKTKHDQDEYEHGAARYLNGRKLEYVEVEQEALKHEIEEGNNASSELQNMSMPELWKLARSLGLSKKGKKDELIERILNAQKATGGVGSSKDRDILNMLDQLKDELKEFEKIKEGMREKVESTYELVPKLTEQQAALEKEIQEKEKQISEIGDLIPKLEDKKQNLESEISEILEEMEQQKKDIEEKRQKVSEIGTLIPKLDRNKRTIERTVEKSRYEISKTEEQIQQILSIQKYGVDLLSTLMYATKKSSK
jgi:chromosome segregation ATPase